MEMIMEIEILTQEFFWSWENEGFFLIVSIFLNLKLDVEVVNDATDVIQFSVPVKIYYLAKPLVDLPRITTFRDAVLSPSTNLFVSSVSQISMIN